MGKLRAFLRSCVATPFNAVLSIVTLLLVGWLLADLLSWAVYRRGVERKFRARLRGARRGLLGVHQIALRATALRPLPGIGALARRHRGDAFGVRSRTHADTGAAHGDAPAHWPRRPDPAAVHRRAAARRRLRGIEARADHRLGRHHAHHRDRELDDRDLDPAWTPARARPPLRAAGDFLRLRDVHRAVAQPAADRRSVSGGGDVSAVRAAGIRVRQARPRADRVHAVQCCDLRRSLPRRPAGDPARPAGGRAQPRARLLAHHRSGRAAAGDPHRDARHDQHLRLDHQGNDRGADHRTHRIPCRAADRLRRPRMADRRPGALRLATCSPRWFSGPCASACRVTARGSTGGCGPLQPTEFPMVKASFAISYPA